jgi:hypothetical protein
MIFIEFETVDEGDIGIERGGVRGWEVYARNSDTCLFPGLVQEANVSEYRSKGKIHSWTPVAKARK